MPKLPRRDHIVYISKDYSEKINITEETTQASVLRPLYYLVFVNDFNNLIVKCKIFQYIGDTCIEALIQYLQHDFNAFCR